MITPRRTRLHRVPHLHAFRRRIRELATVESAASCVVLVPTRGAAVQFGDVGHQTVVVSRDELYDRLQGRLPAPPRRLSSDERHVIAQAAARSARGSPVRPGLVAEILRFYDQLRRQGQAVDRFEELLEQALAGDAEFDRGAQRMLSQTRFLAATFRAYEARCRAVDAVDEHALRARLLEEPASEPVRRVVVTVGDWIAEPDGLYPADFDLLARLHGLEAIDLVATQGVLSSGFHQRIHGWLPGIEEVPATGESRQPTLLVPDAGEERAAFVRRDREEELAAVASRMPDLREAGEQMAVVYKRPLPYLYLARAVFGGAGISYSTADALPLAAEPFAAALDLLFELVESTFSRSAIVALLRSPHFRLGGDGGSITSGATSALDRYLSEIRYLGGLERLNGLPGEGPGNRRVPPEARPALEAARTVANALVPLLAPAPASVHLQTILAVVDAFAQPIAPDDLLGPRLQRGRAAVVAALESLAAAHAAHDDPTVPAAEVMARIRRAIEEQTFAPEPAIDAHVPLRLMDDRAARYTEVDHLAVVGLIDGEWPERPTRNIFYPTSLVSALGWPTEKERRAAAEARFLDLMGSARVDVVVSTVKLDDETLVEPSPFLDEIPRARLPVKEPPPPVGPAAAVEETEWARLRRERPRREAPGHHGQTDPMAPRTWSISALETYLACPFKFFAQYVLRLVEEPEDEEVMDPRTAGQFVHSVFESFFRRWQREERQAITPQTLEQAREMFAEVVEEHLASLGETEAALERTRLLGSPAAAGLGDAVLRMEAERRTPVVDRLLEHELNGTFAFEVDGVQRQVGLRGKADRIDLLADGTFHVIDYKLGSAPNRTRALQLPIYATCAEQQLSGYRGRHWTLGEAAYVAFKGPRRVIPLLGSRDEMSAVLAGARRRLLETVDRIEAGAFPPTPDDVFRCETCSYTAVCRKDYVDDV